MSCVSDNPLVQEPLLPRFLVRLRSSRISISSEQTRGVVKTSGLQGVFSKSVILLNLKGPLVGGKHGSIWQLWRFPVFYRFFGARKRRKSH